MPALSTVTFKSKLAGKNHQEMTFTGLTLLIVKIVIIIINIIAYSIITTVCRRLSWHYEEISNLGIFEISLTQQQQREIQKCLVFSNFFFKLKFWFIDIYLLKLLSLKKKLMYNNCFRIYWWYITWCYVTCTEWYIVMTTYTMYWTTNSLYTITQKRNELQE